MRIDPQIGVILGVVIGLDTGCGSGGGSPGNGSPAAALLDCAWLTGSNCWKATTDLAAACLPPPTDSGTLNASDTACSYPSGAMVTFNVPLMTASLQPTYDFAVKGANGQPCLTFKTMSNGGFTLDVGGKTVTLASDQKGSTITCPDGKRYSGQLDLASLFSCTDASLGSILPGYGWLSGQTYNVSLTGTADPSTMLTVFSCGAGSGSGDSRFNDCAITGGTGSFPPNLCVDFTGASNTGQDGNPVALAACDTLAATCGSGCERTFSAFGNCATTNSGQTPVGTCVVKGGQPAEQTVRFYPPTTPNQAQTYCAGQGGAYSPA